MLRLLICRWNNLAQRLKLPSFQEKSKPFVVTRTLRDLFQIMNKVCIECIWDLRQGCAVYPACLENFVFLGNISCYYYLSQINKNGLFFQMSSKSIKYIFSHQKLQRCTLHLQWKNTSILLLLEELPTHLHPRKVQRLVVKAILLFLQSMFIESYLSKNLLLKMEMCLC